MFNASTPYMKQLAGHCKMYFVYDLWSFYKAISGKAGSSWSKSSFCPSIVHTKQSVSIQIGPVLFQREMSSPLTPENLFDISH